MKFLVKVWEEVVMFFSVLEELYHAWSMSPHLYVIIFGRVVFAIVIITMIVVVWGIIKNLTERGRRSRR